MEKLVVMIMGAGNNMKFIDMCVNSTRDADEIVFLDSGNNDGTSEYLNEHNIKTIFRQYDENDKNWNGKQRNFYLNYLKENYPDDWALCLDADEVVEDLSKIKEFIQTVPKGVYSVKMRHFIGDLGHEDSTIKTHFVPNRLFKIECADKYPEVEHPVLISKEGCQVAGTTCTTIWHLAYVPNLWEIKKRYENHLKKSNMHTPEFLHQWYKAHLFGQYPRKPIDLRDIPEVILREFSLDKDEFYFSNRGIELKHSLMVKQWYDYFKPESVLDLGCGRGPYLYFWKWYVNTCVGLELSEWAVKNAFTDNIYVCDISNDFESIASGFDLVTIIDVLEHLDDIQLDKTLKNISKSGKRFIFSIPFEGDPNLTNDKTHKQFHSKQWWIEKIESYGIKIKEAPKYWFFHNQILIGEKT